MNVSMTPEREVFRLPSLLPSGKRCMHPNDGRAFFFVTEPEVSYEKACFMCLVRELGPKRAEAVGAGGLPYCQLCEDGVAQVVWNLYDDKVPNVQLGVAVCVTCKDSTNAGSALVRVMCDAGVIERVGW